VGDFHLLFFASFLAHSAWGHAVHAVISGVSARRFESSRTHQTLNVLNKLQNHAPKGDRLLAMLLARIFAAVQQIEELPG
jgi:hypothetical protein